MDTPSDPATHASDIARRMAKVRTKRELAALFRHLGMRCQKRLGQNFLVDHNLLGFMVRAAEVGPDDLAVDIGCGTGLLLGHLADGAAHAIGIEVDRRLLAICSRYLEGRANVTLLRGDALASKRRLAPLLLEALAREWATGRYEALRVVSNLPYSVASLIVPNLLEAGLPLAVVLVTVQKEVADRLAAEPHSKQYGALSVVAQAHARVEVVRGVPPQVFWPRPKVESAIVRLVPRREGREGIDDYARFQQVVRAAFAHRRKSVANALATAHSLGDKAAVDVAVARCGIGPGQRAEHVSLPQYVALANELTAREG